MDFPVETLRKWFLTKKRQLPWRESPTPYQVWVSEVMLQQTQVSVVIPYYERWMSHFPDVIALANAKTETVLKLWEGLGYYSRARNLHEGAKMVVCTYRGKIPGTFRELSKLKGVGPYTTAAILSFAFNQKTLPIDGNVMRVLSRYFLIEEEVCKSSVRHLLEEKGEKLLPSFEPWIISEALIELGALVCQKKAKCQGCPLQSGCLAYRHQRQNDLPNKKKTPKTILLHRNVGVITHGKHLFVQKGGKRGEALADLYEFPYIEGVPIESKILQDQLEQKLSISLNYMNALDDQEHTFTRHRVKLYPHLFEANTQGNLSWKRWETIDELPFSSGHRRILENMKRTMR